MPLSDELLDRRVKRGGLGAAAAQTGLIFAANNAANSDVRIVWSGANLLPRTAQTVIWDIVYNASITGYISETWSSPNDGAWDGGSHSLGMHGHPCDGAFDSDGQRTNPTAGSGTVQYEEIAGLGLALDRIASPASPGPQSTFLIPTNGALRRKVRLIEVIGGTTVRHTYYPDVLNRPTEFIRQEMAIGDVGSGGASPAFYFGASDWRSGLGGGGGTSNDETPNGRMRNFMLFNAALPIADAITEAASESNTPVTSTGAAALWYINKSPTPTDIADKSGAGHHPSWATASRPTLWTL